MKICPKCQNEFDPGKWNKAYCSRKCANSRKFTDETNSRRSLSNSKAIKQFTEEKRKQIIEKRITSYRVTKPESLCKCGIKISPCNKYQMCWNCYIQSDVSSIARGHHYKNYKRLRVVDSAGSSVLLMSSMEIAYYNFLIDNNVPWLRAKAIQYTDNVGERHWYKPDFYLPNTNQIIEIKGHWWNNDKSKMQWVIEQNPELDIKIIMKPELTELVGG